jgi:hypothetical protein
VLGEQLLGRITTLGLECGRSAPLDLDRDCIGPRPDLLLFSRHRDGSPF